MHVQIRVSSFQLVLLVKHLDMILHAYASQQQTREHAMPPVPSAVT